jgi:hypothetical protein
MGLSYQDVKDRLNTKFQNKNAVKQAAHDFQGIHGPKGRGEGGKQPYRFGNFAPTYQGVVDPAKETKWLIDTGKRNWDTLSFEGLQELIRDNLSDTGAQIPMKFIIQRGNDPKARADWLKKTDPDPTVGDYWEVTLTCRTEPF